MQGKDYQGSCGAMGDIMQGTLGQSYREHEWHAESVILLISVKASDEC